MPGIPEKPCEQRCATTPVGALDSTDCSWGHPHLIIAGASQPDWGPAGPGAAGPATPPAAPSGPAGGATPRRPLVVRAPARIRRAALLRRGVKVTITAAQAGTATATLRVGRRVVARRSRRLVARRAAALTLKPSRRQAARVRNARTLKLVVRMGSRVHAQRLVLRR